MESADLLASLQRAKSLAEQDPQGFQALVLTATNFTRDQNPQVRQWVGTLFEEALTRGDLDQPEVIKGITPAIITLLEDYDPLVLRAAITSASTLYPNLFKEMCYQQDLGNLSAAENMRDSLHRLKKLALDKWSQNDTVAALNSNASIDSIDRGIELRSVKFVQQLVLTQSQGPRDPRIVEAKNDISLSFLQLARNQPVDNALTLEAEAAGLLDRLLLVFSSRRIADASIVTATINAVGPLIRVRPTLLGSVMRNLLAFDSSRREYLVAPELQKRYIDKCLKIVLSQLLRTTSVATRHGAQIEAYLRALADARATENLTRQATNLQTLQQNRQVPAGAPGRHGDRVGGGMPERQLQQNRNTEVPGGEVSFTWVYSLLQTGDPLLTVNTRELPMEIVAKIAYAALVVNGEYIEDALNVVRARLRNLAATGIETSVIADLEPESEFDEADRNTGVEDIADNDDLIADDEEDADAGFGHALATVDDVSFLLPEPTKLSENLKMHEIIACVDRVIEYGSDKSATTKVLGTANKGVERVALSEWNKNAWVMLVSRLFTRGLAQDQFSEKVKAMVREKLYGYIMDDFRFRIEALILWLTEEFFASEGQDENDKQFRFYVSTLHRAFDQIIPLLEDKDTKLFLRLLSDLPYIDQTAVWKIKSICIDPYRYQMGFRALKYLIALRPPTRDAALDLLQEMFIEGDSKTSCAKILKKHRPEFLQSQGYVEGNGEAATSGDLQNANTDVEEVKMKGEDERDDEEAN